MRRRFCVWFWVVAALGLVLLAGSCGLTPVPPEPVPATDEETYFTPSKEITATEDLHLTGDPPEVDIASYRLRIEGLVDEPLSLTYQEILDYPTVTEVVLLICPTVFQDNAEWTGVPVWVLLTEAGVQEGATDVTFRALPTPPLADYPGTAEARPYFATVPLDEVMGNDSIFLAHNVNGEVLPEEHGYPLRVVAKDRFGYDWVKWVASIEVE